MLEQYRNRRSKIGLRTLLPELDKFSELSDTLAIFA